MNVTRVARALKIRRIGTRLRGEGGWALPTTMLMLMAAFATVSVGVVSAVRVQSGTNHDQRSKEALQLAQTGVSQALFHFNKIAPTETNACYPVTPSSAPGGGGWCAPVGPITEVNGGTFTYQAHPYDDGVNKVVEVVATGQIGGATRRVMVRAKSLAQNIFGDAQVKTSDHITLDSNSSIHASAATNGDITLNSNAAQCGQASVGIGRGLVLNGNAGYYSDPNCNAPSSTVNQQQLTLPQVNPGDIAINNDNARLFGQDPISGNKGDACFDGRDGNGGNSNLCGTRELYIQSNSAVTLTGSRYFFCKLTMRSNSSLYIAAGHAVAIYFDDPQACGYTTAPVTQIDMESNTRISSTEGTPANVALLFVGSPVLATRALLSSNTVVGTACQQNFVIYAPLTDIEMNSNSTYCGAIAAKSLHLDSNADVRTSTSAASLLLPPTAPHYSNPTFVECSVADGGTPTSGC